MAAPRSSQPPQQPLLQLSADLEVALERLGTPLVDDDSDCEASLSSGPPDLRRQAMGVVAAASPAATDEEEMDDDKGREVPPSFPEPKATRRIAAVASPCRHRVRAMSSATTADSPGTPFMPEEEEEEAAHIPDRSVAKHASSSSSCSGSSELRHLSGSPSPRARGGRSWMAAESAVPEAPASQVEGSAFAFGGMCLRPANAGGLEARPLEERIRSGRRLRAIAAAAVARRTTFGEVQPGVAELPVDAAALSPSPPPSGDGCVRGDGDAKGEEWGCCGESGDHARSAAAWRSGVDDFGPAATLLTNRWPAASRHFVSCLVRE
mmetsp:Transcript_18960/g.47535  ORF Transcript_18960/g.47535 Transcript_18960/m.47535 type:complete len:322 (-) Transcript_18960:48-1013(-)